MAKRQNNQHPIGSMVHYGKPEEVIIEHLVPDAIHGFVRYIEHVPGYQSQSSDDAITSGKDRGDFHPDRCHGRTGVAKTWTRDGRTWCLSCYRMRYGRYPTAEELTKRKPRAAKQPHVYTRKDFGL